MSAPAALHYAPRALLRSAARFTFTTVLALAILLIGRWEGWGIRLIALEIAAIFVLAWRNLRLLGNGRLAAIISNDTLTTRSIVGTRRVSLD